MTEYTDLDIKHFKLVSGDEILGLIAGVKREAGVIYIEHPVLADHIGDLLHMTDYMPGAVDRIVAFSMTHIVAQCDVIDEVKENYIRFCIGERDEAEVEEDDVMVMPEGKMYH
jgi:hypothetical protein